MQNIKEKIENLRATLRYHSDRYYNDDAPEIEDYEYDMMMRELKGLEEKYPEFDSADSPTKRVGVRLIIHLRALSIPFVWKAFRTHFQKRKFSTLTAG